MSGCARFTLAFANGDTSRSKGESESLLSSGWKEERGRAERRAREKRGASGGEGGFAPKKRVTRHVIPALPLLFVAPGARTRYPGPGPVREDIYRGVQDASTPTYDGPSNDILLARLVTPHLPTPLPLSSVSPSAGLSTSLFLSPFLSRSQNALSRPAFPRGWIAARGYVRNCGTKSAFAEELTVHRGGHKVLLILIDFDSRKPVTSGYE